MTKPPFQDFFIAVIGVMALLAFLFIWTLTYLART